MSEAALSAVLFVVALLFSLLVTSPLFTVDQPGKCQQEQGIMIDRDGNIIIRGVAC